ncbi:MAG: nitroreductase family protein [Acidimicrobiales bacterium]|jgi:nitroreductase|nr:nitroreductase family protein [Acidimicrobiales bacterium]
MTVADALSDRRSCRSFTDQPLAPGLLDDLVDRARRTPTAGNCQGVEFLVLEGKGVVDYWDVTLPVDLRETFPWPGLLVAPVLVVPWGMTDRYLDRYGESDKVNAGLSRSAGDWPVPYWLTDAAFAAMALQLLVVEAGLGCCFFGLFGHEGAVAERFDVPEGARAVGAVAIGHPDLTTARSSGSAERGRRPLDEVLHRGEW